MAPVIMGAPNRPGVGRELAESFCRTALKIAKNLARVTSSPTIVIDFPSCRRPVRSCSATMMSSEQFSVIGHDWGSMVAWHLAASP